MEHAKGVLSPKADSSTRQCFWGFHVNPSPPEPISPCLEVPPFNIQQLFFEGGGALVFNKKQHMRGTTCDQPGAPSVAPAARCRQPLPPPQALGPQAGVPGFAGVAFFFFISSFCLLALMVRLFVCVCWFFGFIQVSGFELTFLGSSINMVDASPFWLVFQGKAQGTSCHFRK